MSICAMCGPLRSPERGPLPPPPRVRLKDRNSSRGSLKRTCEQAATVGGSGRRCEMAGVRYERQESVGHIILDRPPANSYDKTLLDDMSAAIDEARFDSAAKAIVVRSASERFFSAGADVKMFASTDAEFQFAFVVHANEVMSKFE